MIASIAVGIVPILQVHLYRGLLYLKQAAITTELEEIRVDISAHRHAFHECNFDLGLSNEGCVSFSESPRQQRASDTSRRSYLSGRCEYETTIKSEH